MIDTIQIMLQEALQEIEPATQKITVTITGTQYNGDGRPRRQRSITIHLAGKQAQDFLLNPTLDALWDEYGAYLGDGITDDRKQTILIESITAHPTF